MPNTPSEGRQLHSPSSASFKLSRTKECSLYAREPHNLFENYNIQRQFDFISVTAGSSYESRSIHHKSKEAILTASRRFPLPPPPSLVA
eukprot:scaffold5591_cov70-Skeletonema_dohrnii-CCMP3373.AAC.17